MDEATLNKQIYHQPSFFAGWNGPVTAGATLVTATQNQYTFSGAIGLVRAVPTVSWLESARPHVAGFQRIVWKDHAAGIHQSRASANAGLHCRGDLYQDSHLSC